MLGLDARARTSPVRGDRGSEMHNRPQGATPVVGALTTLVERWVSQDVARGNAAAAASRLHRQRRELDDVDAFLAARQGGRGAGGQPHGHRMGSRGS